MSRAKTIRELARGIAEANDQWQVSVVNLGKAYSEGFVAGSGQSSITALERQVIVAALEMFQNSDLDDHGETARRVYRAARELNKAIEREATE